MDILKKWGSTGKNTMLAEIMQTGDELASEVSSLRQDRETLKGRIAQLERELETAKGLLANGRYLELCEEMTAITQERDALAAIVIQQRDALETAVHYAENPGHYGRQEMVWKRALALDISKAESILSQRDAEVLRKVASKATHKDNSGFYVRSDELRSMADDIQKGQP